ncbi:MAG TPA: type II toxin-antitoxin system prevent-host-death family antitoxin [Longimicrobiales bacterium]|nr:type II toxin-antitoxin system prevent-host-death family antitoxin [Longimicrobiales bacterium]
MYRVPQDTTVATVTDLRRRTSHLMERADQGDVVVVQKDNHPQGVYLSFRAYQQILARLDRLESLELAELAVARKAAVDRGEMGTTSLEELGGEFGVVVPRGGPGGG